MWSPLFDAAFPAFAHPAVRRHLAQQAQAFGATTSRTGDAWWTETDEALIVTLPAPGVTADQLDVTVEGRSLTVDLRRGVDLPEGWRAQRLERGAVTQRQVLTLPDRVNAEQVTAELRDGRLTLTLPRTTASTARSIPVNVA
jgi:HSP20 family protein